MNHAPQSDFERALKGALKPEPASAELRHRMLTQARRAERPRPLLRGFLLAAAAVLVVGVATLARPRLRSAADTLPLDAVVTSASAEFSSPQDACFRDGQCSGKGCGEWARHLTGFSAPLPACVRETDLSAGGSCRIAGQPAAHYLLQDGRMVYVFAKPFASCPLTGRTTLKRPDLIAEAWNEEGRGYLMMARR